MKISYEQFAVCLCVIILLGVWYYKKRKNTNPNNWLQTKKIIRSAVNSSILADQDSDPSQKIIHATEASVCCKILSDHIDKGFLQSQYNLDIDHLFDYSSGQQTAAYNNLTKLQNAAKEKSDEQCISGQCPDSSESTFAGSDPDNQGNASSGVMGFNSYGGNNFL